MVESMLSFTSICEAANVTGVAEFDVVSLKCDRGGRFYQGISSRSVWEAESVIGVALIGVLRE